MSLAAGENPPRSRAPPNKRRSPPQRTNSNHKRQHFKKNNNNNNNSKIQQAIAINKKLIACDTPFDVLNELASIPNALTGLAGGGALNSVNFSTGLHRIARYVGRSDARAATLSDAKFALFLCSLSEALAGMDYTQSLSVIHKDDDWQSTLLHTAGGGNSNKLMFNSRECSNIAWAISKLRIAPPQSALPIDLSDATRARVELVKVSHQVRQEIVVSRKKSHSKPSSSSSSCPWIPTLSLLSGRLLDNISILILSSNRGWKAQEAANLLYALAMTKRATVEVFDCITSGLIRDISLDNDVMPKPQELSNSVYSFGKAQIFGKGEEELLRFVADALDERHGFVNDFKPQEISNTAWGVATILANKRNNNEGVPRKEQDEVVLRILRHVARSIAARADDFKSQELSNTAWAMATLGFGLREEESSASALNDYIFLHSTELEHDQILMARALDAIAESATPRLHSFQAQELNNVAWAFSRLGRKESTQLYEGIGRQFANPRRRFTGQDVGTTLWALSTVEYANDNIYRAICSRITMESAKNFKAQECSNAVWAVSTAGVVPKYPDAFDTTLIPPNERLSLSDISDDPITLCFAVAANELMRRPHEFKSQEIKDVMWSFSRAGIRHPRLFKSVAEHLVGQEAQQVPEGQIHIGRGLDEFSPQGIGNLAWSYAKQAQLAGEAADRIANDKKDSNRSGRLAVHTTICLDVGENLVKRLFNSIAETDLRKHAGLSTLSLQDIANTAWSFAVLGLRHVPFFDAVSNQIIQRLSRKLKMDSMGPASKGQELANIIWAAASVNQAYPDMLDVVTPYLVKLCSDQGVVSAKSIAKYFKRQEAANIAWSCSVMGYHPPELMQLLYTGLVGHGDGQDPDHLRQVYKDEGLQRQATMSLLYVQLAMDLEDTSFDLRLPEHFPDGWDLVGEDETMLESLTSMLTLSTSRIQTDVSRAFGRIGFEHVEEHVISMDDLANNYGPAINLSPQPLEILSIDIADVSNKIGIEVDGPAHFVTVLDTWSPQEPAQGYSRVVNGKLEYQFMWDRRHQINGSTALKERLLYRLGWKLLHVPFWEWYAMKGNSELEDEYCRKLLRELNP